MTVQLTIVRGKGVGQTLSFDQPEIRIGRTHENDIVVLDPGVSRSHARLFERDGRFVLEDLKSINGTRLNGAPVQQEIEVTSGDTIILGQEVVVFEFALVPSLVEDLDIVEDVEEVDVVPVADPSESTVLKRIPTAPPTAEEHTVLKDVRSLRRTILADGAAPIDAHDEAYVRMTAPGSEALPQASSNPALAVEVLPGESAADAYRRMRQERGTLWGRTKREWGQSSSRGRVVAASVVALFLFCLAGGAAFIYRSGRFELRSEPTTLTFQPIPDSFGLGEGVTFTRPDSKSFDFELASATQAVAIVHFHAADIEPGELVISVNGVDQGEVPPDVLDTAKRELEQVLSPADLKRNATNTVTFDSLHNPPQGNPWRIWNVWIEIIPIPDLPQDELLSMAKAEATRGRELNELRNVGADNLFKAWKAYRTAWLMLEAVEERPPLYEVVRGQMKILANQLDIRCGTLMLEAERAIQLKEKKRARQTLEDVARHFPTREHRCQAEAYRKMDAYGL